MDSRIVCLDKAVFFFCRTEYSSLIRDEEILQHYLQCEIMLYNFLLSSGGKKTDRYTITQNGV